MFMMTFKELMINPLNNKLDSMIFAHFYSKISCFYYDRMQLDFSKAVLCTVFG